MTGSKPMDVVDSSNRHVSAKGGFLIASDLRPIQDPCLSPHSLTSSVATDATTPRFGCSPGHTDSLSGSPSSLSSMMSIASYRHGDAADTEDDPDTDLYPVTEVDEIDSRALASMDISDENDIAESGEQPPPKTSPAPKQVRGTHNLVSVPPVRKPLKGRVFELLADDDDSGSNSPSCPHEWNGEINEPPPPQPNVTPLDTAPPVPSPLSVSISGDDTEDPSPLSAPPASHEKMDLSTDPLRDTLLKNNHRALGHSVRRSRRASRSRKPLKSALSSSDDEQSGRNSRQDRKKYSVRFCLEPEEQRTHSPVEYDRKACPVHNRLCNDDLRELRDLHMPMDLLASRWSALKLPHQRQRSKSCTKTPKLPEYDVWHSTAMQSSAPDKPLPATGPTCLPTMEADDATSIPLSSMAAPTATAHRDPVAELKAVRSPTPPTYGFAGAGRSYAATQEPQNGMSSTLTDSLAARFGLTKPPPPLPGVSPSSGPRRTQSDSTLYPMPQPVCESSRSPRLAPVTARSPNVSGYESPSTDLGDYGTEYAMIGG